MYAAHNVHSVYIYECVHLLGPIHTIQCFILQKTMVKQKNVLKEAGHCGINMSYTNLEVNCLRCLVEKIK